MKKILYTCGFGIREMKAKQLFITILFCLLSFRVIAQIPDSSYLSCTYSVFFIKNVKNAKIHDDEARLEIGKKKSRFYSVWEDSIIRIRTQIFDRGGSLNEASVATQHIPHSYQYYNVEKWIGENRLFYSDKLITEVYGYEETLERPAWKIETRQKEIAGYNCQKATANYKGREWTVWFAPAIPISEGPWKLWGLPGLILKAEDAEKQYTFTCIEIKQHNPPQPIQKRIEPIVRCTHDEWVKLEKDYMEDYNTILFKELGYREPIQPGQNTKVENHNPIER